VTELRRRVERLEHLATNAASVSATAEDLQNFPGNKNLVAGANITLTPGTGTLTIAASGGGGGSGTVTSVSGSGGSTGLTLTGGPITTSGTLTLGGTLAIASGGTSATTAPAALTALGAYPATNPAGYTSNTGTVTSVGMSVPAFLSVAGSPVTTTGTLAVSYSGTALPIANGGTGATSAAAALTALGAYPATNPSGYTNNTGTVTSVNVTTANGVSASGGPITGSGSFTFTLGAITPSSVSTGALTASGAISLPGGSITRANQVNGGACSIVGRSANSSGVLADITMTTNDRLLARVANVVQESQLTAGMVPNSLITDAMLRNSAGLSVIGRSAASSGAPSDIASTGARTFLASSSTNIAVAFRAIEAADFPGGNWMGATSGTAYAAASTAMTVDGTWTDTSASVSLVAGTYLVTTFAQGFLRTTASLAGVSTRLYNVTDAAAVTSSECCIFMDAMAVRQNQTGGLSMIVTVAATKTIRLEAARLAGGAYAVSPTILSDANGRSGITYVRLY